MNVGGIHHPQVFHRRAEWIVLAGDGDGLGGVASRTGGGGVLDRLDGDRRKLRGTTKHDSAMIRFPRRPYIGLATVDVLASAFQTCTKAQLGDLMDKHAELSCYLHICRHTTDMLARI